MVTPRSLLLLAAVLAVAAAASSHAPSRFGLPQRPTTTTEQPPPAMEDQPAQNTTGDIQAVMTQMAAIMVPRIQAKLKVLFGNIGRAISGALFATLRTGFKIPLTAMFVPLANPVKDLDSYPPGYIGDDEALRMPEPVEEEDDHVTERKLS